MSVTLLEAVAAGCQIIATDVGGNREVVGAGALLVPPRQPMALRNILLPLLASERCQAAIVDIRRFHWDNIIDQYAAILQQAAAMT